MFTNCISLWGEHQFWTNELWLAGNRPVNSWTNADVSDYQESGHHLSSWRDSAWVQIHGSISKKWLVNVRWQPCHFLTDEARVYGTVKAMNHSELFVHQAYAAFYGTVESRAGANQEPLRHCLHLNAALTGSQGNRKWTSVAKRSVIKIQSRVML